MINTTDDDFEIVRGIDGKPVRVLRDGGRIRVSMQMRDAALRDQRRGRKVKYDPRGRLAGTEEWEEEEADDSMTIHDGRGNPCGHRPGFLIATDAAARSAKLKAYRDYQRDLESAYKNPPTGAGSKGPRGQREGDLCTINGAPGHLQMRGGQLVCVPDRRSDQPDPASDHRSVEQRLADKARIMTDEYRRYDETVSNLWRNT